MSAATIPKNDFHREWGPDDNGECSGYDDCVFELTSSYVGLPGPSGLIPHLEVTYWVKAVPADETNQPDETGDLWGVEEVNHSFLLAPDDVDRENPVDEDYNYEGGSHLWYYTEASAIAACKDFAASDESWKLNDWIPA